MVPNPSGFPLHHPRTLTLLLLHNGPYAPPTTSSSHRQPTLASRNRRTPPHKPEKVRNTPLRHCHWNPSTRLPPHLPKPTIHRPDLPPHPNEIQRLLHRNLITHSSSYTHYDLITSRTHHLTVVRTPPPLGYAAPKHLCPNANFVRYLSRVSKYTLQCFYVVS